MLRFKKGELNSNLLSPRQHLRGPLIGSSTMNLIAGCTRTMGATGTFGIKNAGNWGQIKIITIRKTALPATQRPINLSGVLSCNPAKV